MRSSSNIIEKKIELSKVSITLLEDSIVRNYFKFGELIEPNDVREIRNHNLDLVNYQPYAVLIESDDLTSFTKEARDLAGSKELDCRAAAKAIVIKGLAQRIIADFFIKFSNPIMPTKIFDCGFEAIAWLREEVEKEKLVKGLTN